MLNTSKVVGHEFQPRTVLVEQGQIQLFAKATGATDSTYWDPEAARRAGHRALPAPPTFLLTLELLAPSKEPSLFEMLGIDIGQVLHAGQRYKYAAQIYAGDEITITARITDAYDKKNGTLQFIVSESSAVNQHCDFVGSMVGSIMIRNQEVA